MSFPRYERYKDSGVEWLGEVPEHWEGQVIKRFATFIYGDALPTDVRNEEGGIPVYGSNGSFGQHDRPNTECPVILIGRKGSHGAINWSERPVFAIDTVYFIDGRYCKGDLRWLYWALHIADLSSVSQDTGVPGLSRELAHNIHLAIPRFAEQQAISAFLDRETVKIDALVAEQRSLIDLLKEKRQAIISHAVTKGLDPDAPMKDSGVAWLGDVPEHWAINRLKHSVPEVTVGIVVTPAKYYVEEGVPCLRSLNVKEGALVDSDLVFISPESNEQLRKSMIFAGDLVAVRTGQPGTTAVVDQRYHGCNCIDLIIVRKSLCLDSFFLCYLANSQVAKVQVSLGSGGAIQQHFNIEMARDVLVPQPPFPEQLAIVAFLDRETARLDALVTEAETAIALLQERRAALISAAVTGKIDVRGLVRREAEAAGVGSCSAQGSLGRGAQPCARGPSPGRTAVRPYAERP